MTESTEKKVLFLSRPEVVTVHLINPGESVDEALERLEPQANFIHYFVAEGQDATHILTYQRSGLTYVTDAAYFQRLTIEIPLRSDGCVTCSLEHMNGITDLENPQYGYFEQNTVASLAVKGTTFRIQGQSGCIDPQAYRIDLGIEYATKDAMNNLWPLEGYAISRLCGLAGVTTYDEEQIIQTGYSFDGLIQVHFAPHDNDPVGEIIETPEEEQADNFYGAVKSEIRKAIRDAWSTTADNGQQTLNRPVLFRGLDEWMTAVGMGVYLLDFNTMAQDETECRAMFFHVLIDGKTELLLANKELGAVILPNDQGLIPIKAKDVQEVEAVKNIIRDIRTWGTDDA